MALAIALETGVVNNVVVLATTTGAKNTFSIKNAAGGGDNVIEYTATGTYGATTVKFEESTDGGTTWVLKVAAIDMVALPTGYFNALAGKLYRPNIVTIASGNINIDLVLS